MLTHCPLAHRRYDSDETGFLSIHDLQLAVRTLTGVGISETDLEEALDAFLATLDQYTLADLVRRRRSTLLRLLTPT